MGSIFDDDADRINSEIRDWDDPEDLKQALQERFPKWREDTSGGQKRFVGFKNAILDRKDWYNSIQGERYIIVETQTRLAGGTVHRMKMITDAGGRYFGKPENVETYTRHGNVYGHNIRTGKRAKLG